LRQARLFKSEEDLPLLLDCNSNSGDASADDASADDASADDASAGSSDVSSGDASSGDDHESLDESFELQQDICGPSKKHATVQRC
jgi:hypothetical protein